MQIEQQVEQLRSDGTSYSDAALAHGGAIVHVGHDGALDVTRGLIKSDDQNAYRIAEGRTPKTGPVRPEKKPGSLSAPVAEDLTKLRTQALACELAERSDIALATIVHAMALQKLYRQSLHAAQDNTPVTMVCETVNVVPAVHDESNGAAGTRLEEMRAAWMEELPESADVFWNWCLEASPATLNRLLAFLVGTTLNAVETNPQYGCRRIAAADRLADCLNLDMTKWWQPSEAYFKRVPKPFAVLAVLEAGCDQAMGSRIGGAKKADAVAMTLEALSGKGWLPAPLRTRPAEMSSDEDQKDADCNARTDEALDQ